MPSYVYRTKVKESGDGFSLSINATHVLSAGESSSPPTVVKGRPPEDLDVVLKADLVLSFAATADGHPVSGLCLQTSSCLRHVLDYLKSNEHQLGLGMISDMYTSDDVDDRPKVTLSSAWPYGSLGNLQDGGYLSLALEAIHIVFLLQSTENKAAADVFSERAYLPFTTALDHALRKFATLHLTKRYPLIFGEWRRKINSELDYVPSISKSILNIFQRSTNEKFKKRCRRLLSGLEVELSSAESRALLNLAGHLKTSKPIEGETDRAMSNEDLVTLSITRFLRLSVRPAWGKMTRLSSGRCPDLDKEELQIQNEELSDSLETPPSKSRLLTHDLCWDDLSLPSTDMELSPVSNGLGYPLDARDDEDNIFDFQDCQCNGWDDAILDDSRDKESGDNANLGSDGARINKYEDTIFDSPEDFVDDMIYEDEDHGDQVAQDNGFDSSPPELLDDFPWELDSWKQEFFSSSPTDNVGSSVYVAYL
ncbi:hypothetical protein BDY19DRAFT_960649 [Irpex rosettiformis]|uniref:Uncharacterized protein n=1 Tax=Irpex rosettiformis TaxID=378272 RepID=A0ACB8TX13_9APHY|nr:hypothetical protein BDY19DRAFT_960649 [Irpex rosettiformis]